MKVSIIIPAYNVDVYLERCLNSLCGQTFSDLEAIVIDDGSSDRTLQIAESYTNDPRFHVYTQDNRGPAAARDLGLKQAKGDYIMFLDADDAYHRECIEKAYRKISETQSDIVAFGLTYVDSNGRRLKDAIPKESGALSLREHPEVLMQIESCAWDKIYRRELFTEYGHTFPEGKFEDHGMVFRMLADVQRIAFIGESLIDYTIGRAGNCTDCFDEGSFSILQMTDLILSYHREKGTYELYKEELKALSIINIVDVMKIAVRFGGKEVRDRFLQESSAYLRKTFGDLHSKYELKRYKHDFLYFHPFLLKMYLLLKGKA